MITENWTYLEAKRQTHADACLEVSYHVHVLDLVPNEEDPYALVHKTYDFDTREKAFTFANNSYISLTDKAFATQDEELRCAIAKAQDYIWLEEVTITRKNVIFLS